ncbi:MAG TPA: hypothetical protein DDY18_06355 [Flavobacterium sp.]|nr:hypothetical protein [Flavobacterium sp.]
MRKKKYIFVSVFLRPTEAQKTLRKITFFDERLEWIAGLASYSVAPDSYRNQSQFSVGSN